MRRDPLETVTVELGGKSFGGWSQVRVTLGVEQAVRTAELEASDYAGALPFAPGTPCRILASGDLLLTGYVRDVKPSHSGDRHSVSLSIVSRAIDAVEASIAHRTGFAKDKTLNQIAEEFDTAGVGIEVDEEFPVEPASFVNTGSSLFRHVEPLARSHSALIYDTPEGKLRIRKGIRGRHAGALSVGEGGNIISASAVLTEHKRFSKVIVRGQASKGVGAGALRIEAQASDPGVLRDRPLIIVHESETTSAKLKERAERAVKRAAGEGCTASIEVTGWRDGAGHLFEPHFLIAVDDPRIYINQDMAIKSVTLEQSIEQDGPGTRTKLDLCDPRALNGEKSASKAKASEPESAGPWKAPEPTGVVGIDY